MLKNFSLRKIGLTSAALFAMVLIYVLPSNEEKLKPNERKHNCTFLENLIKVIF